MIFIIALNSFHLRSYDDITQGPEEYSSKTIYTQLPSDKLLKGPTSNEQTSTNSRVTTLMVELLSIGAQLLSPSILTWAMFSGLLHQLSGLGTSSGLGSLVQGCQLNNYWFLRGPASLLHCPLFCIQTHSSGSLAEILQTISDKVVRTTTSKTISIFLLIQLNCIGKIDNIANWLICSTNPTQCFWVFI